MKTRQKIRKGIITAMFFILPAVFYYLSPYLIIEAAAQGIVAGSFIVFSLMFVSALVLGRAWCGWACPAAGCQEAIAVARTKPVTRGDLVKWIIWVPWVAGIIFAAAKGGGLSRIDFFYKTTHGFSAASLPGIITYLAVVVLITAPAYIFGRRSFCHHVCWMAPFMITGRKIRNLAAWPSLRLARTDKACTSCKKCTRNCPMSLDVDALVAGGQLEHAECILCGTCADVCPAGCIRLSFSSGTD